MAKRKSNKLQPVGTYANRISGIKNQSNAVGTYRQNAQNRINDMMARIREEEERRKDAQSRAITKGWQDASRAARYSADGVDRSYEVYAAKMMHDSPGTLERLQKEAEEANRQKTKDWQDASRAARYSQDGKDNSYQIYAAKQIADSKGSAADKLKQLNDFLSGLPENKAKDRARAALTGDVEHSTWLGTMPKETRSMLRGNEAHQIIADMEKGKSTGEWDELEDPAMWSSGKRAAQRKYWQAEELGYKTKIDELNKQIEQTNKEGTRWDALLDLYSTPETDELRKIISGDTFKYSTDEVEKAKAKLEDLYAAKGEISPRTAYENAQNYITYHEGNLYEYWQDNGASMRKSAYDAMNGEGAYDQKIAGMNGTQRREFDNRIDDTLQKVLDPAGPLGVEKRTTEMYLQNVQDQLKNLDAIEEREKKYESFMSGRDYADTEYHPENNIYNDFANIADENDVLKIRPADEIYAVLGGDNLGANYDITTNKYYKAALMDDQPGPDGYSEQDIFISYYNAGLYDDAEAFYRGLEPFIDQRYSYFEKIKLEDQAMRLPGLSTAATVLATPLQTVEFIANLPGYLKAFFTGEDNAQTDEYGDSFAITRYKNITRNKITEALGNWGWVYQGVTSGMDSALNATIGKGLGLTGNALQYGTLALFGTQAFETSLQHNMESSNNYFAYDFIEAFMDAAIETATEIWSVENWLADPTNIVTYVGKIAISEPSEEIVGAIVEPYIKEILGHGNQWKDRARQIIGAGGYYDADGKWVEVTDADKATRQALREWNHEIRMAAQTALVSIGPAAMYGSAQIALGNYQTGAQIQRQDSGLQQLVTAGQQLDQDTESYKLAQKMQGQLDENKRINKYETGKLAGDIIREGRESAQTKEEQMLWDTIAEEVKGAENAEELTEIVIKALKSEEGTDALTKGERKKLNASQDALKAFYKYRIADQGGTALQQDLAKASENERKAQKSVAELVTPKKPVMRTGSIAKFATQDEIRSAEAQSQRTGGQREVIVDGKFANVKQVRVEKIGDKWQTRVELEDGRTVGTSQLLATNYGMAQIINQAAVNPEFYSEQYTNMLMKAQEAGRISNTEKALEEATRIRIAAYIGNKMPQTSLDRQLASEIYVQSANEHAENGKKNLSNLKKGTVKYGNYEYGTKEYNEAVSKLDANLRSAVDYVANVFHAAGIELNMEDMQDDTVYGTYNTTTKGVSINLFGKDYTIDGEAKGRHNIVVTAAHELTHWLKEHSPAAYKRLEQYVMQQYAGKDYNEMVRRLNHFMYQEGLSLEDAIDEIVANSSDQVLGDEKTVEHIRQTDSKLFGQIRSFVQDLVNRMKKAISGMRDSASKDARFMLANRVNEIGKLWTGAWDEALSRAGQETMKEQVEGQTEQAEKYSKHEFDGHDYILIEEPAFSGRTDVTQEEIREYLKDNIGDYYTIIESGQKVMITKQTTKEYAFSGNTRSIKRNNIDAYAGKANAASGIDEIVEIASNRRHEKPNHKNAARAKYGAYRYDTVFAVKVNDAYKAYDAELIILNYENGNKELYDLVITKEDTALEQHLLVKARHSRAVPSTGTIAHNEKNDKKMSKAETKNNEGAPGSSMVDDIDNMEQAVTPSTKSINDNADTVKLDREYEEAVKRGDIKTATDMLMEKLRNTQGVIPFMAPEWDAGENRVIAKALKTGDPEVIATAADKMSDYVPDNAVLIPMPGRSGKLTEDSWTVKLANAIGEKTGRPVVLALEGAERGSRHEAKASGEQGASQEELGFHQVAEIPEGTFPIFVDNIVGKGVTADAAREAMGGGMTLAYTKSLRSPGIAGLKNAVVTYESKSKGGGLIPLSERFNVDKRDVRYSKAEEALDAGVWLMNQTVGSFQTEDERTLWQAYKDKRISMSLCLKRQIDYRNTIRELESKDSLTGEQQRELETVRDKLEKQQERMVQLEKEMQQITSTEGYAGMMYRYNMVLKDFVQGRTSDQVRETVEGMLQEVKNAQEQITRQAEELKQLEQTQAVKAMKSFLGKTSLEQQAAMLRKQFSSAMNKQEISDRLAEMALKLASGQDIQTDAEALAADLVDKIRGIRSENLESLRGVTLNIGENLRKELQAENSSMKELRTAIYGSGVKIKAEGNSRLVEQWNELRNNNQSLPDIDGMADIDALHTIIDYISGELQASSGSGQYDVNMEEAAAICYGAAASVTTYIVKDPAARKQITELMGQIRDLSRRTGNIAEGMDQLNEKMQEVVKAGYKAADWTGILQNDVKTAIDYYNKVARQAAQEEKAQVKKNLIDQLRSENARKLYEQQDKYEQQLRDSRKARETAEENLTQRNKINTNISRLRKRLTEETDKQNIPEETKALARYLCGKLVNHDMTDGLRRVLFADKKQLQDFSERLKRMDAEDGGFDPERDLDWLVIKAPNPEDNDYTLRDKIVQDLRSIDNGLLMYWTAEGNGLNSLENRRDALKEISDAVAEISSAIRARGQAFINNKRYELADLAERMEDEMSRSAFKGERRGYGSRAMDGIERGIGYGNLTPEYFFKNLKNSIMSLLHKGFNNAENRSGLMAAESQARMEQIAEETGFRTWDGQEKHKIKVNGGREIDITTEQLMALYATWQREKNNLRPEATAHLLKGGFVLAQEDTSKGKPGRERIQQRPVRMSREQLDTLGDQLTPEQKAFVDKVVEYMSTDLAEVANETSMETYGIRKFTEKYYFPIKSWGGVLSKESTRGVGNKNDNAAMRQSFTKRITAGAQNAIEIGDFTPTAMRHIAGMITFNTVGPAVENLNRVLNYNLQYGEVTYDEGGEVEEDNTYKRSVRAAFQEAYGKNAMDYLQQFMQDINGGTAQGIGNTVFDKLLSTFRKGAVAGSLSVALQQPLSYIRAAMMINPKYLASAIAPWNWGKIHEEMTKYSGIAVIKDMGRFDMQLGRSMIDYITPDGKESGLKTAWTKFSDATTILPEKMDAVTWGRMWIACKMEQAALQPGVDQTSDEFLQTVAERFNEVMRRTQVYDSVMVKSQNMRTKNPFIKSITSFMAEPTLSLNVLSDAVKNAGQKGGKTNLAKAGATFLLSAVLQALVKGLMSSGRSPDKKKTWEEQFLAKWFTAFMSEANPVSLIPGYSDLIELLKKGELNNDALGVIGKVKTIAQTTINGLTGKGKGAYRDLEDTVGQLAQIFTNVPVKNLMRDARAMYNYFNPDTYANRATSAAVIKYSVKDAFYTADNMLGTVNTYLQMAEAGYGTSNSAYYKRIYEAQKANNRKAADEMTEYMLQGKGVKEETVKENIKKNAKADETLTTAEQDNWMIDNDLMGENNLSTVTTQYKEGKLTRAEAEKLYKKLKPDLTENDLWWKMDQMDYNKENGGDASGNDRYYRLKDAINANKVEQINKAVKDLLDHGVDKKKVKDKLSDWKSEYLEADSKEKIRIRDAIQKAYKALGLTAADADKVINGWKDKNSKTTTSKKTASTRKDTTGRYGKGNIDLNNRKVVKNADGTISTEESITVTIDGQYWVIPTIINGKRVSDREATDYAIDNNKYLGKFDKLKDAEDYAVKVHERQDWYYHQ